MKTTSPVPTTALVDASTVAGAARSNGTRSSQRTTRTTHMSLLGATNIEAHVQPSTATACTSGSTRFKTTPTKSEGVGATTETGVKAAVNTGPVINAAEITQSIKEMPRKGLPSSCGRPLSAAHSSSHFTLSSSGEAPFAPAPVMLVIANRASTIRWIFSSCSSCFRNSPDRGASSISAQSGTLDQRSSVSNSMMETCAACSYTIPSVKDAA
mmetsp:Transcript_34994/g.84544  ORF Transcript_34994/g.84544 Transcript_34994/m.84544 type:complete len:212 (+) Transcript_34994:1094-1729(+)